MQPGSGAAHPAAGSLRILFKMQAQTSSDSELAALLAACAQHDRKAFQRLYDCTAPQLLASLVRILRQRALAEDALQDVFVQVWNRAGQYEPGRGSAWGWLIAVARYRAIDLRRREGRSPAETGMDLDTLFADGDSTEAAELGLGERASRALAHCMGALQPRQRECIALAFQGGLTHPEVAAEIGEPLGSVKSWIRRGLAALKRCLES
jgi:RNA polymerase sigma-70 factor, ECF subfamily